MKPTPAPGTQLRKRSAWRTLGKVAAALVAAPLALFLLLYAVLIVTPIPLPLVNSQIRNMVLASMPAGSKLELGDMALALEGFSLPVVQFSPVVYTDTLNGGSVRMEALEVGISPVRMLVGQPAATVTVVGPHLQVNQDLFGPRIATFEYEDGPNGERTVRVIEGSTKFPEVNLSSRGLSVVGDIPAESLGIRSDNDWLVYNLEAAAKGVASIVEQARLGNFSRLVIRRGALDMNDALYGVLRHFTDMNIDIAASGDGQGASGKFSAEIGGSVMNGIIEWVEDDANAARMKMSITNFDPSAFAPLASEQAMGIAGTMSVSIDVGFTAAHSITDGLFHVDMTGMDIRVGEQYFPIATSIAEVKWDPAIGQFTVGETQVSVADSTGYVSGVFKLGLDPLYGPIVGISMSGRDVAIHNELGAPETPFSAVTFKGWSAPLYGATGIDHFEARKADGSHLESTGRIDMVRRGTGFDLKVAGDGLSADDIKRIWPAFVATESRDWFVKNIIGGKIKQSTMRYSFPVGSLAGPGEEKPLPKDAMSIDITGVGVQVKALDTMEPVNIDGEMKLSMRGTDVTISADGASIPTPQGAVSIANAAFVIGAASETEALYEISGELSGGLPALLAWAKQNQPDALKQLAVPVDLETLAGNLSLGLVTTIVTDRETNAPHSMDYTITGQLQDFGTLEPVQGHTVGNGQLDFRVTQAGFNLGGTTEVDGIPAEVAVQGKLDPKQPDLVLSATVDAEAFKKLGVDVSAFLDGKVTVVAKPMADGSMQMVADLEDASLDIKDLGIGKAAGAAGTMQAQIRQNGDLTEISRLDVAFGDVSIEGNVGFSTKDGLKSAEFTSFALSPGDAAQLSLAPIQNGYEVRVRGDQLDMKPMLKRFFDLSGGGAAGGATASLGNQTIALDVELKRALGYYRTTAYNVNLDVVLRGEDLQRANLQANLGGNRNVSVTTNATPDGKVMSVAFNDLGTLLRLMNVYPNVEGGEGSFVMETVNEQKLDNGVFSLRNFAFVNEKNVEQILSSDRASRQLISSSNKLEFRSAEARFIRRSDRIELVDAVLAGTTVGGTARGFIYTDKGEYDIAGTYVPLFGLNNAFSKILGPLAGREGEGLFGVTFAVQGPLNNPEFKVNPVSALVPGAFRRMFEYRAREIPREE